MNTCPKCGSQAVTPESYQYESKRVHFRCDSYGYNDKEKFDLVYRSELCCEREEKKTLQRKVEELQVALDFANEAVDQRERSRFYFKGYWYGEYLEMREKYWKKMGEISEQAERSRQLEEQLQAKLDDLQASTIHSCGDSCSRPMCVLRKERDQWRECSARLLVYAESLLAHIPDTSEINWTVLEQARAMFKEGEAK